LKTAGSGHIINLMYTVVFCPAYGNIINKFARFCPFCGNEKQDESALEEILDGTLVKVDRVRHKNYFARLELLARKLEALEQELDSLVSTRT
jgi:hypothetical protein